MHHMISTSVRALGLASAILLAIPTGSWAAAPSPVGSWQSIRKHSHAVKAVFDVRQQGDTLTARVVKLYPKQGQPQDQRCSACKGVLANHPIEGLTIIWGLHKEGDDWVGGRILDPTSGKVYSAKMMPAADGKSMEVRGYLGTPLFGKSQTWYRR